MSIRPRLAGIAALVLALAGTGGYAVYWFHVGGQLRKGVEDFAAARRAEGWRLDLSRSALSGFPAEVILDLGEVALATPAGIRWNGSGVRLRVPALDPLGPTVELGGSHRIALGGEWRGIVTAASATVRLRVDGDGDLHSFAFDAARPVLEQPGAAPLAAERLEIGYRWLNPPDPGHEKPSARFTLAARAVDLPLPAELPLEKRLGRVELDGRIMGTIPETAPLAALAAWSAGGGIMEIDRLAVDWGALEAEADGTFAFDPALQPLLATTARLRGWNDMLGRLVKAGLVEPAAASAAEVLLAILARPDPQGRPTLTLAVSLQDGYLYAGQARLLKLPPLPIPPPGPGAPPS